MSGANFAIQQVFYINMESHVFSHPLLPTKTNQHYTFYSNHKNILGAAQNRPDRGNTSVRPFFVLKGMSYENIKTEK